MRIGELARSAGQTPKTIRFYEAEGLMPDPPRTPSGYRVYGDEDIERLRFIRMAKRLGLSLGEIGGILCLHDRRDPTCAHVRSLLDEKLAQIERALAELQAFRSEISRLKDEAGDQTDCRPSGGGICSIIEESGIDVDVATRALNLAGPTPR
jgi:DNA-binding transcriptional MerR regulator